jgi:hypothetical protein
MHGDPKQSATLGLAEGDVEKLVHMMPPDTTQRTQFTNNGTRSPLGPISLSLNYLDLQFCPTSATHSTCRSAFAVALPGNHFCRRASTEIAPVTESTGRAVEELAGYRWAEWSRSMRAGMEPACFVFQEVRSRSVTGLRDASSSRSPGAFCPAPKECEVLHTRPPLGMLCAHLERANGRGSQP